MKTAQQHNFGQVGEVILLTRVQERCLTHEDMTNLQASEERFAKALSNRSLRFTVLIDPMGAVRQTHADRWKKRDCVLRYAEYKHALKLKVGEHPVPDELHLKFHIAMPASWSGKQKARMTAKPHRQKPDKDNLCKGVMDALWENDQAIWRGSQEKFWAESGAIEIQMIYHP
jgi:Holliday junction resolvase RusA-like endonuclease